MDRQVHRAPGRRRSLDLKTELEETHHDHHHDRDHADTAVTTQVYRVYIKATPQAIWDAITKPEWTNRYGYTGFADYDLRPGGAYEVAPNEEFKAAGARRRATRARTSSSTAR